MSREQIERQIWMMDEFIRQMRDPHEIAKIQKIMKAAAEGEVVGVAPAKPAITRVGAVLGGLSSIAESDNKDTGRK
jgi:hypothetical protein